ncbi:hypothetical protein K438DRAFT_1806939 [Mycena galopus ATCC 62051]|nr:hypothetical protein K438DRAFT_1806939 [Mycena galopus ATCC 62051]
MGRSKYPCCSSRCLSPILFVCLSSILCQRISLSSHSGWLMQMGVESLASCGRSVSKTQGNLGVAGHRWGSTMPVPSLLMSTCRTTCESELVVPITVIR